MVGLRTHLVTEDEVEGDDLSGALEAKGSGG